MEIILALIVLAALVYGLYMSPLTKEEIDAWMHDDLEDLEDRIELLETRLNNDD